jgi:hypothetical protein
VGTSNAIYVWVLPCARAGRRFPEVEVEGEVK